MKSSHQMLMLAILMGLSAWLLDAVISWYFFPGKPFLEMLWAYDPQRTLFARSAVVCLFFCFGLYVGYLVENVERQKALDEENLRYMRGIQRIQHCSFRTLDPDRMIEETATLFRDTFLFQDVLFIRVQPETRQVLFRHTTREGVQSPDDFKELEKTMARADPPFTPSRSSRPFSGTSEEKFREGVQVPLAYRDTLYGFVLGTWTPASRENLSKPWEDYFFSACNQIAQSIDHLQRVQDSKRQAEEIKALFDLSPLGVFTITESGKEIYANPALRQLLSATTQVHHFEIPPIPRWFNDPQQYDICMRTLAAEKKINDFEFELRSADGSPRTAILCARLNQQADDGDSRIEGFLLDITNRRQAEEAKLKLRQEIERNQHFKAVTVLAGGVAHEFNNILQAMMGSAYLGKMKLPPDQEEVAQYLDDIQSSGARAAKLCDQMLSYAGKRAMVSKLEVVDECLQRILLILNSDVNPSVKIDSQLDAEQVRAHLDFPSFSEAITNLVLNALESVESTSNPKVQLKTAVRSQSELTSLPFQFTRSLHEDQYWVLSVQDNGCGISREEIPRIFEPFYTTKFQGRGLGLSVVSGIIEKFDGTIGVRSKLNVGTEMLLCLPIAEEAVLVEDTPAPSPAVTEEDPEAFALKGRKKIWVVDDEPLIGETVMRILTQNGYDVSTEQNSKAFLERFSAEEAKKTDCLLLDLTMPEVSGLEILKSIRKEFPDLPVMIMSGYDEQDQKGELEKHRISGFVHKPFQMRDLLDAIDRVFA